MRHSRIAALGLALAVPGLAQVPDVPVFGLGGFERGDPISITADKLEAQDGSQRRRLTFRRNVLVRQGGLSLRADRLEAVYDAGASEPARLSALGRARIEEGTRRASCGEVSYDRDRRELFCRGEPAELWDAEDQLSGREIRFDLADHRVVVEGDTRLVIHREWLPQASDVEAEIAELGGPGPVTVQAQRLEARDEDGNRQIHFSGEVRVTRGGLELRADELVLNFPAGANQPEQFLARGQVQVRQTGREADCAEAEYRPGLQTVVCRGGAELRQGNDRLASEQILLDLGARQVDATGGATLWVDPSRHSS